MRPASVQKYGLASSTSVFTVPILRQVYWAQRKLGNIERHLSMWHSLHFLVFTTDSKIAVKQSQACIKFVWIWPHCVLLEVFKPHSAPLNLACYVVYSAGLHLQGKTVLSLYMYKLKIIILNSCDCTVFQRPLSVNNLKYFADSV